MKVKQTIVTILTGVLVSVNLVGCQSTQEEWDNPVIRDGRNNTQMTEEHKAEAQEKLQDKESKEDPLEYLEDFFVDVQKNGIYNNDLSEYYYPVLDTYTLAQYTKEVNDLLPTATEAELVMSDMIETNVTNTRVIKIENVKWKNDYEVQITMIVEHPDFQTAIAINYGLPETTDKEKIEKGQAVIHDALNNCDRITETFTISMVNPMLMVKNGVTVDTKEYNDEWLLNETEFMERMFFFNHPILCD